MLKAIAGLLYLGESDFEAIEPFRQNRLRREALDLGKVPSGAWMCQRLDAKTSPLRELTDALSARVLFAKGQQQETEVPRAKTADKFQEV